MLITTRGYEVMPLMPRGLRRGVRTRYRRGQAEVIGGLIVLTIIFMLALPIILSSFQSMQWTASRAKTELERQKLAYNEKIAVGAVSPNNELAVRAGWIPGIWINNTGTVEVTLKYLYLIDIYNNTIYKVFDLRYARPEVTPLIKKMMKNVDIDIVGEPIPYNQSIKLAPGENLLIVFNESLLPMAPYLIAKVSTESGILHPLAGGAEGSQVLYPSGGAKGVGISSWRGIFMPLSGFGLRGYDELSKSGYAYAWRPPIHVYPVESWWFPKPTDLDYYESFIYEDSKYPGLYYLYIRVKEYRLWYGYYIWVDYYIRVEWPGGSDTYDVSDGDIIVIRGFVGTYDAGSDEYGTYFNGYAFEVKIYRSERALLDDEPYYSIGPMDPVLLGDVGIKSTDFDGNGVSELTFYSLLNGPNYSPPERINIDADLDGDTYRDALVWTYIVARDISNIDFVKITVKLNYYWTETALGCPTWDTRDLKIFAIGVWKYNSTTDSWQLYQFKNFGYTSEKPVQFQETAVFPLDYNGTYRVGVLIYDNYRDWDFLGGGCYKDFTMSIEHIIVEYGIYNPLFRESPPVYLIAVSNASLIGDIGEEDYIKAYKRYDVSLDEAKVLAQQALLSIIKAELDYAGIVGYTIINSVDELCNLLLSADNPPRYAIIIWLQGNISITDLTAGSQCAINDYQLAVKIEENRWVWVWAFSMPFDSVYDVWNYNERINILGPGSYEMVITEAGISVRKEAYAFYLYNNVTFMYNVTTSDNSSIIVQATLYADNPDNPTYYGTVAFWTSVGWAEGLGVIVLNPVHVDWDASGDGAIPETIAQQVVYSSLKALEQLKNLG